ncbi:hypothetical protein [Actinokineospora bangkokensis]|uniref:DUF4397 domain-containing protein n=1 Tax=Actinokineospora bangkokensis TaxID=1193682 RepID=A0A1Q9LMA8_9PSEU|nr:hypothetical protein [Actinokineospora bangkokensis]OLR93134.1 hypothetical protein BJP25_00635 [Actinokineospora bangkokensis]
MRTSTRRALAALTATTAALLLAPGLAAAKPVQFPVRGYVAAEVAAQLQTALPARFTPLVPQRVLDTRTAGGPVGPGGTTTLDLSARVPAGASAVVLNLTALTGAEGGFVTAYPAGTGRPQVSNLNAPAGSVRPNAVTVALGATRAVTLYNQAGNTHLVVDLAGYYKPATGSYYTATTPTRVLDTRQSAAVGPREVVAVATGVPAGATAVTLTVTGIGGAAGTYVTAYPGGSARPEASNLNLAPGQVAANLVTVPVGPGGRVDLFNLAGSTHLVVDVAGFYTPGGGSEFTPLAPFRVGDTRDAGSAALARDTTAYLPFYDFLPEGTTAVAFTLTGTAPTAGTYLTAAPTGAARPLASNLNLAPGETAANLAVVALNPYRELDIYNFAGSTHAIVDLAGFFGPATAQG